MRFTRLVATLLAVLAGALGVTTSMAGTTAHPPAAQPGQVVLPDSAPLGLSVADREAMARPVCFSGNTVAGTPLNITASGTESALIVVSGDGVPGP